VLGQFSFKRTSETTTESRHVRALRWPSGFADVVEVERRPDTMLVRLAPGSPKPRPRSVVTLEERGAKTHGRVAGSTSDGRLILALGERGLRRAARTPVKIDGWCARSGGTWEQVRLVDLSASGALISGARLQVGETVRLAFQLPDRPGVIDVRAQVVRQTSNGALGCAFCLFELHTEVTDGSTDS
jgi:PilZ domain-containing protein